MSHPEEWARQIVVRHREPGHLRLQSKAHVPFA